MRSSEEIAPLVVTPNPIEGESLLGYLLRVSEVNGYPSPTWITNQCGIPYDQFYKKRMDLEKLGAVLGQSKWALGQLPWLYFPNQTTRDDQPIKVPSAYKPLTLDKPKICSACIEETGITNPAWDIAWFHVCPKHQTYLWTHCPTCGDSVSWCRPGLNVCHCGAQFPSSTKSCKEDAVIEWLYQVDDLIHARSIYAESRVGMPVGALQISKFSGVMMLFDKISKVIEETKSERVVRKIDRSPEMLGEIAKFFSDWPKNFHGLLRQMHDKAHQQPESIAVSLPTVLKKLFGNCRGTMLIGSGNSLFDQLEFSDGAYFYSPSEGRANKGAVLKTERGDDGAEYATISNLATHLDVHKATIKSWAKSGVHGLALACEESLDNRPLVKLNPDFPKKTNSRCLTPRLASKYIGIPETVLTKLRQDGYYKSQHFSRFPGDFQADDLDQLSAKFLRKAPNVLPELPSVGITLDEIRRKSFGSAEIKYGIYRAILDERLKLLGRISKSVRGIVIDSMSLNLFIEAEAYKVLDVLPAYKAAQMLDCSSEVIFNLCRSGFLLGFKKQKTLQVSLKSLEQFKNSFISCSSWAKHLNTSARALVSRYAYKLPMVEIEDHRRGSISFFCLKSALRKRLKEQRFVSAEGQAVFGFPEDSPISMIKEG
jgi:hypothetical protein